MSEAEQRNNYRFLSDYIQQMSEPTCGGRKLLSPNQWWHDTSSVCVCVCVLGVADKMRVALYSESL